MSSHDWIAVGAALLSVGLPVVKLWLRLRFRVQFLRTAAVLPDGSQIRESTASGAQLTVTLGDPERVQDR